MDDLKIPVYKREQLGKGVRGKHLKNFQSANNIVALLPEIQKAFPNSEAVNNALASVLVFAKSTQKLSKQIKLSPAK